jgi:hypothetical protein
VRLVSAWVLGCAWIAAASVAYADDSGLDANAVVERVNARDDGAVLSRRLEMDLIAADGSVRTRSVRAFRRQLDGERRSVLFFEEPAGVKGTAFLSWDYADPARPDDQWLYLPELRKTRRIALAERGRAFLGTDLSFDDMKKETKVEASDYRWSSIGEEQVDGRRLLVVEGAARDEGIARETGYGRVRMHVDGEIWMPRLVEYWAPDGAPLKTVRLLDLQQVDGIWIATRIEAENLQTGHRTVLRFAQIDAATPIPEDLFGEGSLRRGPP